MRSSSFLFLTAWVSIASGQSSTPWKKHEVFQGAHCNTAVAGEFSGDQLPDIIANCGGKTRLFVAPDWKEVVLDDNDKHSFIHAETMDVDGDGDLDFIGARYQPGLIVWLEQPDRPLEEPWSLRIVSRELNGIHGLLVGDVDLDGKVDLIANSAQPVETKHPESLAWLAVPAKPKEAASWKAHIFAKGDAKGLSHYLGVGDVNGDGRPDAATGAKGLPSPLGNEFAWWEAPEDPTAVWKKHLLPGLQPGATNIHPRDVNGDGKTDFMASRGHGRGVIWFEAPDWEVHQIHATLKEPHSLIALDLDGDGDVDAATCAFGDREAYWFENDGKRKCFAASLTYVSYFWLVPLNYSSESGGLM
ncbi:MAG: VCBS repeat-containing protein, partial [Verrucomicrobiota bacterium]